VPFFKRREPTPLRIKVPRLNDDLRDVELMAEMFEHARTRAARGITIPIDFSECDFLRPTAVAAIGGIVAQIRHLSGDVAIRADTLKGPVRATLQRNGFLAAHGLERPRTITGQTSVTYRHDLIPEASEFARFLSEEWLGRHWFTVGPVVQPEIVKTVVELYNNAFEHSQAPTGFFSCGQLFPNINEVVLACVDFGATIPKIVRTLATNRDVSDQEAILWALQPGHSTGAATARISRGLGFDVLLDLISGEGSHMEIYSGRGSVRAVHRPAVAKALPFYFPGTLIQITVSTSGTLSMLQGLPKPDISF
jgi:hypothetical protein